jgi:hypothetical protein
MRDKGYGKALRVALNYERTYVLVFDETALDRMIKKTQEAFDKGLSITGAALGVRAYLSVRTSIVDVSIGELGDSVGESKSEPAVFRFDGVSSAHHNWRGMSYFLDPELAPDEIRVLTGDSAIEWALRRSCAEHPDCLLEPKLAKRCAEERERAWSEKKKEKERSAEESMSPEEICCHGTPGCVGRGEKHWCSPIHGFPVT